MAKFIVHIHLQEANSNDYSLLQPVLQQYRFKFTKHLSPDGPVEYMVDTALSIHELTQIVMRAIGKTGKKFSFTLLKEKLAAPPRRQVVLK